jgi:micrococcal nuclease
MVPWRRRPRTWRFAWQGAVILCLLGAAAVADRAGLFGRTGDDLARYDNGTFKVVHVTDGDTLDVDLPDYATDRPTTRIRLWGVDTPETVKPDTPVQHFGPEASAFAKGALAGQQIRLKVIDRQTRDKYKRLLAYVYLPDGKLFNKILVEEGYGYADPRFPHPLSADFARAMKQARKAGKGLWASAKPSDLPEYLHRQGN